MPENEENRNEGEIETTSGTTATEQQRKVALAITQLLNDELFPLLKLKESSIPDVETGKAVAMNGVLKRIHELTAPFCNN